MLYIYRPAPSASAVALAAALREMGVQAKKITRQPRRGGRPVVCWGGYLPTTGPSLNATQPVSKVTELEILTREGVATVEWARTASEGWLARSTSHSQGDDLLNPPARPGYWVRREEIKREFRVHVWGDKSVRVGIKVPRTDSPHEWIRSWQAGWKLDYGAEAQRRIRQEGRDVAKAAVKALGLDFGAVDVGRRTDGSWFVLEVNKAPGLEGVTLQVYAQKVKEWYDAQ